MNGAQLTQKAAEERHRQGRHPRDEGTGTARSNRRIRRGTHVDPHTGEPIKPYAASLTVTLHPLTGWEGGQQLRALALLLNPDQADSVSDELATVTALNDRRPTPGDGGASESRPVMEAADG